MKILQNGRHRLPAIILAVTPVAVVLAGTAAAGPRSPGSGPTSRALPVRTRT